MGAPQPAPPARAREQDAVSPLLAPFLSRSYSGPCATGARSAARTSGLWGPARQPRVEQPIPPRGRCSPAQLARPRRRRRRRRPTRSAPALSLDTDASPSSCPPASPSPCPLRSAPLPSPTPCRRLHPPSPARRSDHPLTPRPALPAHAPALARTHAPQRPRLHPGRDGLDGAVPLPSSSRSLPPCPLCQSLR